jgi:hypothetical protein
MRRGAVEDDDEAGDDAALTVERIAELGAAEQFILTVTEPASASAPRPMSTVARVVAGRG